jgi:RNA recognition motif-containing protein
MAEVATAVPAAPVKTELNEPNPTLYVSNIDWKVKKAVLTRSLHTLFHRHGKILEIIALRKNGLRGQAFVIFDSVSSATAALNAEQGFTFFGKDLNIEYAREKSDRVAKKDGTFVPKDRRVKRAAAAAAVEAEQAKKLKMETAAAVETNGITVQDPSSLVKEDVAPKDASAAAANDEEEAKEEEATPSNILFADSLPSDCNEMMLSCLFRTYAGYKEVRIPRAGLAFIEFEEEPHATVALKALNGFKLSASDTLDLRYGKS